MAAVRDPAYRDGLALVLGSGLTSVVGLAYWVLAARLLPPAAVGVDQAALSAVMLLGGVAHLNLTYALLRFVPVAGRAARRMVVLGYLVVVLLAALVGGVFALGAPWWAPELVAAVGQDRLLVFFGLATPVWALFTVQDYVLTAIGRATLVPLENIVFAVLKVGLLAAALTATVTGAIAVSWMVATTVLVLAVTVWLLVRALPRFGEEHTVAARPVTLRELGRFVRADYAGSVCQQGAMFGMPLLVLALTDPAATAVYGVVWQLAQTLFVVSSGMNQSMVAHGAADPAGADAARRRTVGRSLRLVVPGAVVLALGGPLVLAVFGDHYAREGAVVLALTSLAAIPYAVTSSMVGAARLRQWGRIQFGVPAAAAVLVIGGSVVLVPALGLAGAGLAWLVGQSLVAVVILLATARWLPPGLSGRIDAVRSAGLLRRVDSAAAHLRLPEASAWQVRRRLAGGSESVVAVIGPDDGPHGALLKASDTPRSRDGLAWQTEVLDRLHADERLGRLHALLPEVLGAGDVGESYCVIESLLPGESGLHALRDPERTETFVASATDAIERLHRCTGRIRVVGDAELRAWVHEPLDRVREIVPTVLRQETHWLAEHLDAALRGRRARVGWTHGDFGPVNLLADSDGRVTGIVDWCEARPDGLQVLDVVVMSQFCVVHGTGGPELGTLVQRWLADPPDQVRRAQRRLGGDPVDPRVLTTLGWLQHVAEVARKSARAAANPVWNRRNVRSPLRRARQVLDRGVSPAQPEDPPVRA
ncbi:phosphotransferase [Pseudonocardia xishanensis]|uniref:phosphotransferase n=1 Tax=Pseudonocardia xishanensis TaxID=630995 RepID=UPI0031EC8F12